MLREWEDKVASSRTDSLWSASGSCGHLGADCAGSFWMSTLSCFFLLLSLCFSEVPSGLDVAAVIEWLKHQSTQNCLELRKCQAWRFRQMLRAVKSVQNFPQETFGWCTQSEPGISQQPGRLKKEAWTQRSVSALEILQHSSRIILLSLSSCTSSGLTSLHSLHERTGSHFPRLLVTKPSEFWRSFIFTSKANNHSAVLLRFCYTYRWQGDFPEKEVLITKSYCCN